MRAICADGSAASAIRIGVTGAEATGAVARGISQRGRTSDTTGRRISDASAAVHTMWRVAAAAPRSSRVSSHAAAMIALARTTTVAVTAEKKSGVSSGIVMSGLLLPCLRDRLRDRIEILRAEPCRAVPEQCQDRRGWRALEERPQHVLHRRLLRLLGRDGGRVHVARPVLPVL